MRENFRSLIAWLLGRVRRGTEAAAGHLQERRGFRPVDVEQVGQMLRVEERGAADGARNEPAPDAAGPSAAERQVVAWFDNEVATAVTSLRSQLRALDDRIAHIEWRARLAKLAGVADGAASRLQTRARDGQDQLYRLREDLRGRARELREFRERRGLTRLPHYPESWRFQAGVLAVVCVAEIMVNARFFALGDEFGLVGGAHAALVFAVGNVGLAVLFGWCVVRLLHHWRPGIRVLAAGGFVVGVALLAAYNLGVAHYREVFMRAPEEAETRALRSLLAHPFGLERLESWMLFGFGCLIAAVATREGYTFDDPCPHYGALDRRFRAAEQAYREALAGSLAEVDAIRDQALAELGEAVRPLERYRSELHGIVEARRELIGQFHAHLRHLEQACNRLLAAYREANRRARTLPAPAGFDAPWEVNLGQGTRQLLDAVAATAVRDTAVAAQLRQVLAEVEQQHRRILDEHGRAVGVFRPLEAIDAEA